VKILLDLPGEGKIIEGPGPIAPGLECIAVPHGLQIASTEPDFHDGGRLIPVDLMTPLEPCLSRGIEATDPRRFIAPGERWSFLSPDAVADLLPPNDATCDMVIGVLAKRIRFDLLDQYPRIDRVLSCFGDKNIPKNAPAGEHDLGWMMRYWSHRAGGRPLQGEFESTATHGSDGWSNFHYHELLWVALNFLRNRRPADWWLGLRMAFAQSSWGMVYHGKFRGMFKGEKGAEFFGQGFQPDWGKQYFLSLVVWWYLTNKHPIIDAAIQAHLECLKRTPATWWGGSWGERQPARYLESLETAFIVTGDEAFRAKATQAVAHIWGKRNTNGLWINIESPNTTSPWMHGKLINNLMRWEALGVVGPKPAAEAARVAIEKGTTDVDGFPAVWYRFAGPEKALGSTALAGFMLPMLRKLNAQEAQRWTDFAYGDYLGSSWGRVRAKNPLPIDEVSIDVPEQGLSGWPKACKELLCGLID